VHFLYKLILALPQSACVFTLMASAMLPLMPLCVAVMGEGIKLGPANCHYDCGANTLTSLVMVAKGAAAAAAVGMQMVGGSSTITAAAKATPAGAKPLLQLAACALASANVCVRCAALAASEETTCLLLSSLHRLERAEPCALRQPGTVLLLLLRSS
jgi:hypothetical protein